MTLCDTPVPGWSGCASSAAQIFMGKQCPLINHAEQPEISNVPAIGVVIYKIGDKFFSVRAALESQAVMVHRAMINSRRN